jgi:chaperonin GroEL
MNRPLVIPGLNAQRELKKGFDALADLLASTLGPAEGIVVHDKNGQPELLNDSAAISRRIISLGDPQRDVGAMLLRNLVWNVGKRVGDGGAMAALLARAMFSDSLRLVAAGVNPTLLAQEIQQSVSRVLLALKDQAVSITGEDDLARMALAFTHDPDLAQALGEMSSLLGPDGHVLIEDYAAPYLERRYTSGATFRGQIASYHLYSDPARKRAYASQASLALIDSSLHNVEDVLPVLKAGLEAGRKSLVILARRYGEGALGVLIANKNALRDKLQIVAALVEPVGDDQQFVMDDLALLSGGTILGGVQGKPLEKALPGDLGQALLVEVTEDRVVVDTGARHALDVQEMVRMLNSRLADLEPSSEERPALIRRLARLSGGMGELRIGALSDHARSLKHNQAERALRVLSSAQREGVVAGGGAAFVHCLPVVNDCTGDSGMGAGVVRRALPVILRQILYNAYIENPGQVIQSIIDSGPACAFDVLQESIVDSRETGLVDSAGVLSVVLTMAASTAVMALKTGTLVCHRNPKPNVNYEP